jgi:hypothetical protein
MVSVGLPQYGDVGNMEPNNFQASILHDIVLVWDMHKKQLNPMPSIIRKNGTQKKWRRLLRPCGRTELGCKSLTHSRSWALLEKPPTVQLLKNFPAFYGTRRFITMFIRALYWSLSWARSIQSTPSHPISLRSILILSTHQRLEIFSSEDNTASSGS